MPAPNRSGGRRSGSYSRQRQTTQRSSTQRRSQPARGGYGNGRSSGGNDQMPLYLGLGVGAVVLIGALAFLLLAGGGEDTLPVADLPTSEPQPTKPTTINGEAPEVIHPFSERDKTKIIELLDKLDSDYDRAKDLKDEGFVAQNRQDYDAAQKAWQEAFRLLSEMDRSSNVLEEQFGEGVWERIERFLPTQDRTLQRWGDLKSDITKQLNTQR